MCGCIEKIDADLAPEHCLDATLNLLGGAQRPMIGLIRRDKYEIEKRRGKPRFVIASFCPWCGEKYPEATHDEGRAAS